MKQINVGKIKNIKLNEETQDLEVTITITDPKFKKSLLRDLSMSGKISFVEDKIVFISDEDSGD